RRSSTVGRSRRRCRSHRLIHRRGCATRRQRTPWGPMTETAFQQIVTLITIVGTGVGTMLVQIYRENRNHRWEQEARDRTALELARTVTDAAGTLAAKLDVDTKDAKLTRAALQQAVAEV